MKKRVAEIIKKALKEEKFNLKTDKILEFLETPSSPDFGDYAFPCFFLAKELKKEPFEIALELRKNIGNFPETDFEDIQTKGSYVNFFLNRKDLARKVSWDAITQKKNYGKLDLGKRKRLMIEFPSPNTNKPLHLGHLRNMAIGESLSRIMEFEGKKVIRANLNNDRGISICKSMLAYKEWGRNKTPEEKKVKSDHFVGNFYVLFNKKLKKNKKLLKKAQEMLRKWEEGDRETLMLWKIMNNWALNGFKETYEKFGIKHDVTYFESKLYKKGKEIIEKGIKKKIFTKLKKGEVKINLEEEELGEKILLRSDGTSLYIVQDLALAKINFDKYKLDEYYYVVGNEQNYHFKVLFSILDKLGFQNKELKHLSYGMVNLPEGKMKSREGEVVDADDLMEKLVLMAKKEIKKREPKIKKQELEERSEIVALSAIKYFLLKVDMKKDMLFNPKEALNFEGNSGPYLLYSYARAGSILKKSENKDKFEVPELEEKEFKLVKKIFIFSEIVRKSYETLNPSLIANYSYELSQIFNEFYDECRVIGSEQEAFRLALIEAFRQTLKNSFWLLGIKTLERM
jgi:arginyl-tRNA synthetase